MEAAHGTPPERPEAPRGLWALALVMPVPVLVLADMIIHGLGHRLLEIDLMLMRPLALVPGLLVLGIFLCGPLLIRLAHMAAYLAVGLLTLPWYLSLARILHGALGA